MNALSLLFGIVSTFASSSPFSLQPYTLQTPDHRIVLRYQLSAERNILLEQTNNNKTDVLFEGEVPANALETVMTRTIECNETINLEIKDKDTNEAIYQKSIQGPTCPDTKAIKPFKFGFISDTQEFDERHKAIANVILDKINKSETQFILNTGDIVQEGHQENEWLQFLNTGNLYMGKVPLIAAIGNHDYRGTKGKNVIPKLFKKYLRWDESDEQGDMVVDFEQFRLMVFNSNYFKLTRKAEKRQLQWMIDQFEDARRAQKPMIVSMHYPIYSSSMNRFTSGSVRKMRRRLDPLFREYGIKLVLSGHTHMYERSYRDGIHYVVAGPAGGRVNGPSYKNKYKVYINPDVLTYTEFQLYDGMLEMNTWNEKNELIDHLYISFK